MDQVILNSLSTAHGVVWLKLIDGFFALHISNEYFYWIMNFKIQFQFREIEKKNVTVKLSENMVQL